MGERRMARRMTEEPDSEDRETEKRPGRLGKSMDVRTEVDKSEARLTREIQAKIGQQLRGLYTAIVDEGVPDRFAELIRRLEEGNKKDNG
jgi:Anti-sigma factor NepR